MAAKIATAQQLVTEALSQVGYAEGAGNANKYGDALGRPPESWCAEFLMWCSKQVAGDPLAPFGNIWTPSFAEAFQRAGRWHTDQSGIVPGDVVFFDRIGAGRISHVGLAINNGKTVEGNTPIGGGRDGVGEHSLPDGSYRGHGRPVYGAAPTPPPTPVTHPPAGAYGPWQHVALGARQLAEYDAGDDVKRLQSVLNAWYPSQTRLDTDGYFGPLTAARVRYMQGRAGLAVDGVAGRNTLSYLNVTVDF